MNGDKNEIGKWYEMRYTVNGFSMTRRGEKL